LQVFYCFFGNYIQKSRVLVSVIPVKAGI